MEVDQKKCGVALIQIYMNLSLLDPKNTKVKHNVCIWNEKARVNTSKSAEFMKLNYFDPQKYGKLHLVRA